MKTSEIPPIKPMEGNVRHYAQQNSQPLATTKKAPKEQSFSDKVAPPSLNQSHIDKLESTSKYHHVAQRIRSIQETLSSVDHDLAKMQDTLESVVKIYPPYPPESAERIDALRQFAALRNMIDQLAAPPTAKNTAPMDIDSNIDSAHLSIDHYQIQTDKDGLNIPKLDLNSSDQDLHDAIEKIAAARKTMGRRQQAFVSYTNGLIAQIS